MRRYVTKVQVYSIPENACVDWWVFREGNEPPKWARPKAEGSADTEAGAHACADAVVAILEGEP